MFINPGAKGIQSTTYDPRKEQRRGKEKERKERKKPKLKKIQKRRRKLSPLN